MHNKSVFKISLILFLCIGLAFGMFLSYYHLKLKDEIEDRKLNRLSKITFSNEETEMFKGCFGIAPPNYLSVLEFSEFHNEKNSYFAIKAAIPQKNIDSLITEIKESRGVELYQYEFTRTPVLAEFDQDMTWFNIYEGKLIASYLILCDDQLNGAAAITIIKIDGIHYVYMWYTNPALISK